MTGTGSAAAATGTAEYPRTTRWRRYLASAFMAVVMLVGVPRYFTLPSCDAVRVKDTVLRIFREQNVELERLTDIKQLSEEEGRTNCAAHARIKGEELNLTYRVFWDGWSKKVQVSGIRKVAAALRR